MTSGEVDVVTSSAVPAPVSPHGPAAGRCERQMQYLRQPGRGCSNGDGGNGLILVLRSGTSHERNDDFGSDKDMATTLRGGRKALGC